MLSFIVPAYNEEAELPATLRVLRAAADAAGEHYEIIVVDDASTDRTAEIARGAGARLLSVERRQIAAVRNAGARVAQGDVMFFVDADTHIAVPHIAGALAALRSGGVGGGAIVAVRDAMPYWARIFVRAFAWLYFRANLGAGAFLFTTRPHFESVGGFDESYFAGEEVFFSRALQQLGRFELLREPVLTSGRKLRMHSAWRVLIGTTLLIIAGPRGLATREKLDFWYDGKREGSTA